LRIELSRVPKQLYVIDSTVPCSESLLFFLFLIESVYALSSFLSRRRIYGDHAGADVVVVSRLVRADYSASCRALPSRKNNGEGAPCSF